LENPLTRTMPENPLTKPVDRKVWKLTVTRGR
jgi:hypothetical protein